ncbi:YdcF family protein [Alteromonas sp. 07-89-2]|uniref:YdcF family protein n=1 Tax=Alteromonas sp. 07-89-2 TaxID=2607609 RepID=UPI00148B5289|nr:YdcF family protein [Alteromonas sp. 07-89-2]MDK2764562.1 YdcF family protein [Alteromonas macleodii]NOH59223.1 YdcF family protein [Alteromonas sp. 07-89-2]|tara:strand:- start:268 stop:780 length:513 start_codon:yes stop_codon:yes gene_type:complete
MKLEPQVYIAIFGSRVLEDGTPSGSLARRISGALDINETFGYGLFFVTGGSTQEGIPTEASVIKKALIDAGINQDCIVSDEDSTDTLESVYAARKLLPSESKVCVCSDNYHVIRISLLMRLLGIEAIPMWITSGRQKTGTINWLYMWFRDLIATFYDVTLILGRKLFRER